MPRWFGAASFLVRPEVYAAVLKSVRERCGLCVSHALPTANQLEAGLMNSRILGLRVAGGNFFFVCLAPPLRLGMQIEGVARGPPGSFFSNAGVLLITRGVSLFLLEISHSGEKRKK